MEETVKTLVAQLQNVVNKQTQKKYSEVDDAMTSLLDYVQEMTANKSGVESRLKLLEGTLSKRGEKKKPCNDHIEKIRKAMLVTPIKASASRTKQEKGNPISPTPSGKPTPSQSRVNQTKAFRNKTSPINTTPGTKSTPASLNRGGNVNPLQGQIIYVQPSRSEGTQTDETKALSGPIDQNEEEYQGEMADEVRFFEECLNGLTKMFCDDTENNPEKIIQTPKGKIKKKVKTGHAYILKVAGDIRRLQAENQYLRTALNGIHKNVIDGDKTTLKELKTPKIMKDDQSILEVEANIKEVTQKFHEIETDAENAVTERECLLATLKCLFNHVRHLSEGETEGDISTDLDEIRSSVKKESSASQVLTHAKEISIIQAELKREAEYAAHLLEKLNELSTYDGKQDTQVSLKEPPIEMARASRKDGKKDHKKQNDEPPRSRHVEQLQQNFASASSVLKKQMNAEQAIKERECLLSTLKCLSNHVRDLSDGKTEGDISSALDEIRSSIKKESTANQGLLHAREISSIQMEWKREAEYAAHLLEKLNELSTYDGKQDTQVSLKEPPIEMARASSKDGKKDHKKQNDEPPRSRHVEQLQQNFASASNVLKKQMNAAQEIKERECLLSTLKCLFNHVRDLSDGKTEGDISSALDEIRLSIKKESTANQGLSHAREISRIQMEWKREAEYVACLLEELTQFVHSTDNGENSYVLSHPQNVETSLDFKTKDEKNIETSRNNLTQSVHNQKLMKHYANASLVLKQMKEMDNLRMDLGKKKEQVEDLRKKLQKMQDDNTKIKNDADSLRTRLSEHAGALLTYENPSIADLSDPNRPTKISEKYSELYDNQWTDAFTNLSKKDPNISEETMIGYLYEMLVDGYRFCQDVRQTQKLGLEDLLFFPAGGMKSSQRRQKEEISKIFAKNLNDVAKLSSNETSANMAKAFVVDKRTMDKYKDMIKLCEKYINECVQLCWLMQVQTPPLCLDLKTIQGQAFDKNCYKEYMKKGKKIAFVVWPALFLHENGPLLHKGVAQGQ